MSLDYQAFHPHADHPGKIKQLFLQPDDPAHEQEFVPGLFVEARIDFSDVRSGCHVTSVINNVLDIVPLEGDLIWTRDMVRTVDPMLILTSKPASARLGKLPECLTEDLVSRMETQYVQYLLRHAEVRIFRNFALNAYSHHGEGKVEFEAGCLEAFNESFRGDLDALRDVVNRRFESIEQKFFNQVSQGEFHSERLTAQARSRLRAASERVAERFLQTELTLEEEVAVNPFPDPAVPDLEHRLETIETDVSLQIARLVGFYQDKVRNIDEYIIHPGLRDLHLVRTCILWMPSGAASP